MRKVEHFDALRLLKSAYGQYSQNEFGQWFSEFNIDVSNLSNLQRDTERMLYDPALPLSIKAEFELAEKEHTFLEDNALEVYRSLRWSRLLRRNSLLGDDAMTSMNSVPERKKYYWAT